VLPETAEHFCETCRVPPYRRVEQSAEGGAGENRQRRIGIECGRVGPLDHLARDVGPELLKGGGPVVSAPQDLVCDSEELFAGSDELVRELVQFCGDGCRSASPLE
jgi:hypothetical protein